MSTSASVPDCGAEALIERLMSGRTLNEALGCSTQAQEALYLRAFHLYNQAKYPQAMRIFAYLMTANYMDARFFGGFGACLQMMREYREALKFYGAASMLDLTDPRPPMHSAECHLALGEYSRAHACIDYALAQARAHQQERHRALVPRLEAMLTFLEKGQTESSHG